MHIRHLTLSAVGPFAGECRIDFDRLGAGGLFLLEGPTGAGKSTIVDALTFALYGTLAGQASSTASAAKIRSDYADAATDTFVELDFETGAGVFRVRRSPEYERPKARGEGLTKERAKASLWRLTPDLQVGEHLSGRVQEVAIEVARIVGLSREQFAQTVVLPQGEFATFLRATPDERQAVLERVFGTGLYERVRKLLEEDRQVAKSRLKVSASRVGQALAAGSGAVGLDRQAAEQLATTAEESLDGAAADLDKAVAALAAQTQAADAVQVAAAHAAEQATAAWREAQQIHARWVRRTDLATRRQQLVDCAGQQEERQRRLACAAQAEAVVLAADELDHAEATHRSAQRDAEDRWAEICTVAARLGWAEPITTMAAGPDLPGPIELRTIRDWAAGQCGELDRAAEVERELAGRRTALAGMQSRCRELTGQLSQAQDVAQDLPRQIEALEAEERHTAALAATSGERTLRHTAAQQRLRLTQRAEELRADEARQTALVAQQAGRATEATDTEHRLRRRRIEGMAAELAGGLLAGQPCPVCGATAHPRPAAAEHDPVDEETVARAESARVRAEGELAQCSARLVELQTELRACTEAAPGTLDQARQELQQAAAELAEALAAEQDAARLTETIEQAKRELAGVHERVVRLTGEVADATGRCTAEEADLAERQGVIEAAAAGWPTVAARAEAARVLPDRVGDLLAVLSDVQVAARAVAECRDDVRQRLDGSFDTVAEARSAALSGAERAELAEQIETHRAELRATELALADPELTDLPPDPADLDERGRAAEQAGAVAKSASIEHAELQARLTRSQEAGERVARSLADHEHLTTDLEPVIAMANLATGSSADARKVTLPSYVLLRRFDEVIEAANDRLQTLSDGRYALIRYGERERGRGSGSRTGLGLRVMDHQTGRERPAATLSGGESFYASLSLALGLADVVRSEAGGVELGTLFIDEGFGSLDPEVLDRVLAVLGSLRTGGRMVGVISHVDTLKAAIPDRLEVRRNADGSARVRMNV